MIESYRASSQPTRLPSARPCTRRARNHGARLFASDRRGGRGQSGGRGREANLSGNTIGLDERQCPAVEGLARYAPVGLGAGDVTVVEAHDLPGAGEGKLDRIRSVGDEIALGVDDSDLEVSEVLSVGLDGLAVG